MPRGDADLKRPEWNRRFALFFFWLWLSVTLSPRLGAETSGILLGRVFGPGHHPLPDAKLILKSQDALFQLSSDSDADGFFELAGIPAGDYSLTIAAPASQPIEQKGVLFEADRVLYLRIEYGDVGENRQLSPRFVWLDLTNGTARTLINDFQIEALPSAGNLWSVIENQDLSATTNRIDVGGVWADRPALWSSRGSSSWTQNVYLLNGLDVSDPYLTGTPLYFPDILTARLIEHSSGQHPIESFSPGGSLNLVPKEGGAEFHGAVSASMTAPWMAATNITPRLEAEGLSEVTRLSSFGDYGARFSGPLFPKGLFFFASACRLRLSRDVAEFSRADESAVSSGLLNLTYRFSRSSLHFLWTAQEVRSPSFGAERKIPFSATLDQKNLFSVFQILWKSRPRPDFYLEGGASLSRGDLSSRFQDEAEGAHGEDILTRVPSGAAAAAGREDRKVLAMSLRGTSLLGSLARLHHRLEFGFSYRQASSTGEEEVLGNLHYLFFGDEPLAVARYNTPLEHRERVRDFHLFAENTITLPGLTSFSLGLHLVSTRGRALPAGSRSASFADQPAPPEEGGRIDWLQLSPRLGAAFRLLRDKSLTLRLSTARYYFNLPLSYLTYGQPGSPGALVYSWTDANRDLIFQPEEAGPLWRREGSYFARLDPDLKRPLTDEYSVSLTKAFRGSLFLTLAGFYRETRDLVETLNTGVPLDAYDPVALYDPGDDAAAGNHDDLYLTVYDQQGHTLGQDLYLLTNPDGGSRVSRYRGLDLTVVKRFSRDSVFFFSATATEAIGSTSPGNSEQENDDGVIGALYDNPNAFLFAKGRLRFDRAYTARLGASVPLPFGFRLGTLVKYYDGQPFSRKIVVVGLAQGPFTIQAFPRGQARYEFNMTVDLRLIKTVAVGKARGRVFLDGYNIFNWAQATRENEWTGPEFGLRYATEVQSPRVFRLGVAYEF